MYMYYYTITNDEEGDSQFYTIPFSYSSALFWAFYYFFFVSTPIKLNKICALDVLAERNVSIGQKKIFTSPSFTNHCILPCLYQKVILSLLKDEICQSV